MSPCRPTDRIRTEGGFTLLELLIVITLFGLFIGAVYETVIVGLRVVNAMDEREEIRQELSNALDRLTREARMARVVDLAQASRFRFDADFDGDGSSAGNEVDIDYQSQSGALVRMRGSETLTLVKNVTSLGFDYIDLNGSELTTPVSGPNRPTIRVVEMTITATNDDESIAMTTSTFLTNM